MTYLVWDEHNGEREDARRIEAVDALAAALAYAEDDQDGWTDGLYHSGPQPLVVERCSDGLRQIYEVSAELVPQFRAKKVSS